MGVKRHRNKVLSRQAFANLHGVTRPAINKAVWAGTIRERPGGGIEVGQQPWELRRQARHASGGLSAKAIRAELTRTAAKLVITRRRIAQMRERQCDRGEVTRDLKSAVHQMRESLLAMHNSDNPVTRELGEMVLLELGDIQAEVLNVTRPVR